MNRFAVLLTVFNRKQLTLGCLRRLENSTCNFDIFLVDDGSTDGTAEAIKEKFPHVNIISGNGNLYWNRGMYLAWQIAVTVADYDYYLWMNDDVVINDDAFTEIFECSTLQNNQAIITGIISNDTSKQTLYGGYDKNKKRIEPNGTMQPVHYLNGNVVLVPRYVFGKLGNLDKTFHHDLGDVDYGLRAQRIGIGVFTTRKFVAIGTPNSISRLRKNKTSLRERMKRLYSPLGSPPGINYYFRRRYYGFVNAAVYWVFLHFINMIPDSINELIFRKKYQ